MEIASPQLIIRHAVPQQRVRGFLYPNLGNHHERSFVARPAEEIRLPARQALNAIQVRLFKEFCSGYGKGW